MIDAPIVFWHWWAGGALLLVVELLAPGMFFLWMAQSAVLTGVLLWVFPRMSWESQLVAFSVMSVIGIALAKRLLKRHPIDTDQPLLNRRAEQYIGRSFVLQEPIVNGTGRLRIDDSIWRIAGPELTAGSRIEVAGADGAILKVVPLNARD